MRKLLLVLLFCGCTEVGEVVIGEDNYRESTEDYNVLTRRINEAEVSGNFKKVCSLHKDRLRIREKICKSHPEVDLCKGNAAIVPLYCIGQ